MHTAPAPAALTPLAALRAGAQTAATRYAGDPDLIEGATRMIAAGLLRETGAEVPLEILNPGLTLEQVLDRLTPTAPAPTERTVELAALLTLVTGGPDVLADVTDALTAIAGNARMSLGALLEAAGEHNDSRDR